MRTYLGTLNVRNAGRAPFTVREAGWIAGDGTRLPARLPSEGLTLMRGGPEVQGTASASKLVQITKDNRGLKRVYVTLVGESHPRIFPVDSGWRTELIEVDRKGGAF